MVNQKVLMLGWEYPPHNSGGLGVACQGLTRALSENQTQIYSTLPYSIPGGISHMNLISGGQVFLDNGFAGHAPPFLSYSQSRQDTYFQGQKIGFDQQNTSRMSTDELSYRVQQYAKSIESVIQENSLTPEVIHAHDWMTFPAAVLLKRQHDLPVIAHVHSTEFDRVPHGIGNQFIVDTESEGLEIADRVIAVSEFTKQILVEKYGVNPDKIDVVHNGIDQAPPVTGVQFAPGRSVIVFMGRLTMQKGAEYFLVLARKVLEQLPNALFVIAGHGDQYSSLLLQAAGKQLSSSIVFTGFLRGQQKDFLLQRADVFVMPSISEPFGLVALEAIQRDTPVIVSKTSGVREVLPGGLVADFWDIDLMVKHIVSLIKDQHYYEAVLNEQLKNIGQVTWSASAQKVKDVYRKILARKQAVDV